MTNTISTPSAHCISVCLTLLLGQLAGLDLLQLGDASQTLGAQQTTSPVTTDLVRSLVVVHLDGINDLGEVHTVTGVHLAEGDGRAGLAADEQSQAGFALDDAIWDSHFAAQGGQEEDHFDGVDVVSDDHELSLLLLDQLGDGVGSGTQEVGLLLRCHFLALSLGLSDLLQALGLGQWRLWAVLVEQLEQLNGGLLVQSLGELVDWGRDSQTLLENGLLALDADVLGPSDETGQITLGLDVLA